MTTQWQSRYALRRPRAHVQLCTYRYTHIYTYTRPARSIVHARVRAPALFLFYTCAYICVRESLSRSDECVTPGCRAGKNRFPSNPRRPGSVHADALSRALVSKTHMCYSYTRPRSPARTSAPYIAGIKLYTRVNTLIARMDLSSVWWTDDENLPRLNRRVDHRSCSVFKNRVYPEALSMLCRVANR